MNRITQFFWICSGAHKETLEKCPSESGKYVGIGATIFFTGVFAAVAAAYALYTVFDYAIWAILFGLVWGLMIFNLDRYIVSGMRKEGSGLNQGLRALPRLILAVLISLIIAKPLEMKIFEKEINEELVMMHQENRQQQESLIRERFETERVVVNNQILALQEEINSKTASRDNLDRIAREEADGTGGTQQRNAGPIYKIKKADADQAASELRQIQVKNDSLIAVGRGKLAVIDSAVMSEMSLLQKQITDGPAARMEALSRLGEKSEAIWLANLFMIFLFLAVETAPIFVKLISHKGPYDHEMMINEYPFETKRIEFIARNTAETRANMQDLSEFDRNHANEQLDTLLKSS